MSPVRIVLLTLAVLFFAPIAVRAGLHYASATDQSWSRADWSSAGLLPAANAAPQAMVRIYSARVGRWRGIFATHSWIVVKDADAKAFQRFDKVGWGSPIRINGYAPDGRWFGNDVDLVFAADGADAEALIPRIRAAVDAYAFRNRGDYQAWPGPNSNTFVAAVVAAVPEAAIALPSTAIGKDYPLDDRWFGLTPSRTGVRVNFGGYVGATLGWVEGIEINVLGGVLGLDLRRPGVKLPAVGRSAFEARGAGARQAHRRGSPMTTFTFSFPPRGEKKDIEEGLAFTPKFDADGLIVCVTTDVCSGDVLMVAYMNEQALRLTIETGVAHYWSRSRQSLWRKGDTSGQVQTVREMRVDCDQDAIVLKVEAGGDGKACHTGRRSCFYRLVVNENGEPRLELEADQPH